MTKNLFCNDIFLYFKFFFVLDKWNVEIYSQVKKINKNQWMRPADDII